MRTLVAITFIILIYLTNKDVSYLSYLFQPQTKSLTTTTKIIWNTVNQKLPFTFDPEYLAARRAYMRYHNMNPIFGISSK